MSRSYLFVPANSERLINRAHERGADFLILDLEDSVPAAEKPQACASARQAIAGAPGIDALAFGPEDFSKSCGHAPMPSALMTPAQQIVWAARSHGKQAIVFPDSIAVVKDETRFAESARRAKEIGSDGVLCIHPKQIGLVADAFTPTQAETEAAKHVVAAFESAKAEGKGAILLDGEMIDLPVVERARAILRR